MTACKTRGNTLVTSCPISTIGCIVIGNAIGIPVLAALGPCIKVKVGNLLEALCGEGLHTTLALTAHNLVLILGAEVESLHSGGVFGGLTHLGSRYCLPISLAGLLVLELYGRSSIGERADTIEDGKLSPHL